MPFIIAEQQEKSEFNDILNWAGYAHNHPMNNKILLDFLIFDTVCSISLAWFLCGVLLKIQAYF
jgi:hypothetical protein